ncbi:MAG: HAD-IIB family hydrolase [Alphaproteobacteria bacterium]|nr:HAD-IIB family hydrolase [Alphaproteobacteria bacterium]
MWLVTGGADKEHRAFAEAIAHNANDPQRTAAPVSTDDILFTGIGMGTSPSARIVQTIVVPVAPGEEEFYAHYQEHGEHDWALYPRSIQMCEISVNGQNFWVVNMHGAYGKDRSISSEYRSAQLAMLFDKIDQMQIDAPIIVMGDFNATASNPDMRVFAQNGFTRVNSDPTKNLGIGVGDHDLTEQQRQHCDIDHIFVRRGRGEHRDEYFSIVQESICTPQVGDPSEYDHRAVEVVMDLKKGNFVDHVVDMVRRGEKPKLVFDIDGTLTNPGVTPDERIIAPELSDTLNALRDMGVDVVLATGRDKGRVKMCFDDKFPPFPVITSAGVHLHMTETEHLVNDAIDAAHLDFIEVMRAKMAELHEAFPEQGIELKDAEASVQLKKDKPGYEEIKAVLHRFAEEAREQGLSFDLHSAEPGHLGVVCSLVGKGQAMQAFSDVLQLDETNWQNVVFFGDSLHSHGNDYDAAKTVTAKGGMVVGVGGPNRMDHQDFHVAEWVPSYATLTDMLGSLREALTPKPLTPTTAAASTPVATPALVRN